VRAVPDDDLGGVERRSTSAAMTGLRQGELIRLRWCDIDWVAGRVRVAESYTRGAFGSPKSHRGRSVPMSDRLAGELERHFQRTRWRGERDLVLAHPLSGRGGFGGAPALSSSHASKSREAARNPLRVYALTMHHRCHCVLRRSAFAGPAPLDWRTERLMVRGARAVERDGSRGDRCRRHYP
jgi:integrase